MKAYKASSESGNNIGESLQCSPDDEALPAGLSLILADAARSHLQAGDLDKAALCLQEAERCLTYLSTP